MCKVEGTRFTFSERHDTCFLLQFPPVWAGVGLTDLGSEAMEISKSFAGIVAAHYPERLYRLGELFPATHLQLVGILHAPQCHSRHPPPSHTLLHILLAFTC